MTTAMQFGTYVGPIAHLRGERAIIMSYWPYAGRSKARWHEPRGLTIHDEVVFVQFNNLRAFRRSYRPGQMRPTAEKKHLAQRWHCFKETDWMIDPPDTPVFSQTMDALATRAETSPASPG